ncbi:MAG: hypothetical protein JSV80_13020 [Acidobacteriota bacterium]|nr:MAG: hypothetical protein JSV80_13020 [Acidobacteriota bacterium]
MLGAQGALFCSVAAPADTEQKYELRAPNGVAGGYYVTVEPQGAGRWRIEADWTGRSVAGLWLFDASGNVLTKRVGASPQWIVLDVAGSTRFHVRFRTTTSRGELAGTLTVKQAGSEDGQDELADERAPSEAPAGCVDQRVSQPSDARVVQALADSASVSPASQAWVEAWIDRVRSELSPELDTELRRDRLDELWAQSGSQRAPDEKVHATWRRLLAAVENLVRRESLAHEPEPWRERYRGLFASLACVSPTTASPLPVDGGAENVGP